MMSKRNTYKSQLLLGQKIEQLRLSKDVSRKQLGKKIKKTEQQVAKYENGDFVPMALLENIARILGEPIQKKLIRKISQLRKREIDKNTEQEELNELYHEALPNLTNNDLS